MYPYVCPMHVISALSSQREAAWAFLGGSGFDSRESKANQVFQQDSLPGDVGRVRAIAIHIILLVLQTRFHPESQLLRSSADAEVESTVSS